MSERAQSRLHERHDDADPAGETDMTGARLRSWRNQTRLIAPTS
jgi:hypothetical protein